MNRTLAARRTISGIVGLTSACICAAMAPLPAQAATGDGDWQWGATVYLWLPSLGGETSFPPSGGGPSIDVSADAILDSLNFAFMGAFEGRKGRWGLATDVIYLDLGASKKATRDFGIGQIDIPATVNADLELDITGWLWTLAGSYEVIQQENFSMNALGGARMLDLEEDLQWRLNGDISSLPVVDRSGSSNAKETQWDAIVGVKGRWTFGADRQWYVPYYLDVGTGESDLTWQGMAGLGYSFDSIDVTGVWRYLDYDFGDSGPIKSLDFNGPALGVTFRF
ncbi:MAG: hypothetical protein WCF43_01875 [Steroidobacteraceae bacterium]